MDYVFSSDLVLSSPDGPRPQPYEYGPDVHVQHGTTPAPSTNLTTTTAGKTKNTTARKRISRACDQCNQLRTKCDGHNPCAHCLEFGLTCEYIRERKKRGKASRKDLAAAGTPVTTQAANTHGQSHAQSNSPPVLSPVSPTSDPPFDPLSSLSAQINSAAVVPTLGYPAYPRDSLDSAFSFTDSLGGYGEIQYTVANNGYGFDTLRYPTAPAPAPVATSAGEWMAVPDPTPLYPPVLRYPVLKPLLPHLPTSVSPSLACDLLEIYLASAARNPYALAPVLRKASLLHPTNPRPTSPALLASILWLAAQTSSSLSFSGSTATRSDISQRLLQTTISLLHPLIHTSTNEPLEPASLGAAGTTDDVITYVHLATAVSASEYKGASLRWWTAAFTLARELKLNRESAVTPLPSDHQALELAEERRRIWWLLYMVDRHLALSYNRPLFLLDRECAGLRQPICDAAWQNGNFVNVPAPPTDPLLLGRRSQPGVGPPLQCTGPGFFGFFLPLMTILGEIITYRQTVSSPLVPSQGIPVAPGYITSHLEHYEASLTCLIPGASPISDTPPSPSTAIPTPTHLPHAYSTHILHVLHILLLTQWDPVLLLSTPSAMLTTTPYQLATAHAVSAADATATILHHDPGLEFMPFFFGVYLLHGSFLLLLLADQVRTEASPAVVRACETLVRAHEACVVTLNTEYQRNFSRVMREAVARIRGLGDGDATIRREILGLYRWTGDGSGLAL